MLSSRTRIIQNRWRALGTVITRFYDIGLPDNNFHSTCKNNATYHCEETQQQKNQNKEQPCNLEMECPWTEIFSNLHNSGKELCLVQNKTYHTCNTPLHHCVMNTCYGPILWQHCLKKRQMHFFNYMLLHHVVIIFVAYLFYSYSKSLIGDFFLSDFITTKICLERLSLL